MFQLLKATAGLLSTALMCSTMAVAGDSAELPAVPTDLQLGSEGSHAVHLSWTDTSRAERGFYILRSSDGMLWDKIETVGRNQESYTDSELDAASRYVYKVAAFNYQGEVAGFSNQESVVTAPDTAMEVEIHVAGVFVH